MLSQEEVFLIIYFILVIFFLASFSVIFFITYQKRKDKILSEKFEAEQKFKEELSNARLEIQEATLKNVSWELHDNIGQLLSIASIQLNILTKKVKQENHNSVLEARQLVADSLAEVRALSRSLNSEVIDQKGLIPSIQNEIDRFNRLEVLEASLQVNGEIIELPHADAIILFRILQEFFANVIKHSGASRLEIIFDYATDLLKIHAFDNGKGYNVEELEQGSGLLNMKSRAAMIKADFKLDSTPGKGTSLSLHYPTKKN